MVQCAPKHLSWVTGYGSEDLVWGCGYGFFLHPLGQHQQQEMDSSLHEMKHYELETHPVLSEVKYFDPQMDSALLVKHCV